jgi:hypothetical protein
VPIYFPVAFFWWSYAYAPEVFVEGAYIAASGGILSIAVAIALGEDHAFLLLDDGRVLDNRFDEPVSWGEVGCASG